MRKLERLINSTDKTGLIKTHIEYIYNKYIRSSYHGLNETPIRVRIETLNACNLKCVTCPQNLPPYTRKNEKMDIGLFRKIVDEIKDFNPKPNVVLYLGGEPLLNPDIFNCIKILKDEGLYCRFNSNAMLLTPDVSKQLLKSGLNQITFSFDDITPDEYEKMRLNATYEITLNNILSFLELKKQNGFKKPHVSIVGIKLNDGDMIDYIKDAKCSKGYVKLFSGFDVNLSSYYAHNWTKSYTNKKVFKKCNLVNNDVNILSNGDVVPCCYDLNGDHVLGNVNNDSIINIWNNEKYICF